MHQRSSLSDGAEAQAVPAFSGNSRSLRPRLLGPLMPRLPNLMPTFSAGCHTATPPARCSFGWSISPNCPAMPFSLSFVRKGLCRGDNAHCVAREAIVADLVSNSFRLAPNFHCRFFSGAFPTLFDGAL